MSKPQIEFASSGKAIPIVCSGGAGNYLFNVTSRYTALHTGLAAALEATLVSEFFMKQD